MRICFKFLILLISIVISACSSSQVFTPLNVSSSDIEIKDIPFAIKKTGFDFAVLHSNYYISNDEIKKINHNLDFVCKNEKHIIASNEKSTFLLMNGSKKNISNNIAISCTIKNNTLAILYDNNRFILQDMESMKVLFSLKEDEISMINTNTPSPIITNHIVLAPTLSGKLLIIDFATFKILNNVSIDFESFNNISFLEIINDDLIVATKNTIMTMANNYQDTIKKTSNFMKIINDKLYVLSENGYIFILDKNLKQIKSHKFKFANLMGFIYDDKYIYILEKQGFIIKSDLNLEKITTFKIDIDTDDKVYFGNKKIYFNSHYFQPN